MKKRTVFLAVLLSASSAWASTPSLSQQFPEGERLVYTRLIGAYRQNHLTEVLRLRGILAKDYPTSVHLDNAYYLSGLLMYEKGELGEALKAFDVVTDKMKESNKRPSALLAKAMTYKRLNLDAQSKELFATILKEYPGSPESQRAWMNLQLEKVKTKTTK